MKRDEDVLSDLQEALDRLSDLVAERDGLRELVVQMKKDIRDMNASPQTIFLRCACGRIRSQGLICPTNAEGGTCEAGR